jgi:hypothetical protein
MRGVAANANLVAANQIGTDEEINTPLPFPSADELHAQSSTGDRTDVAWDFVNLTNKATIAVDIAGIADAIGESHAQVEVTFITNRPVNYTLTIASAFAGSGISSKLNDREVFVGVDDPPSTTKSFSALLPPGNHTYTVSATSGFASGAAVPVSGQTKLELAATAVPLPAGVWPGLLILASLAVKRRLAARGLAA